MDQPSLPDEAVSAIGEGLSRLSPDEIDQLRALQSELSDLSPKKIKVLEQILVFLKKNADRYDDAVKMLVKQGIVSPGDLPPDYIPAFFSILEQMVSQAMSGEEPESFARGGVASLRKKAMDVRRAGTGRDTILAHINPREAAYLAATRGGGMNPDTNLPEYGLFDDIGNFLKSAAGVILPVALGFMGVPPIIAGAIGSGVGAMINGASPGQAVQAAVMGGVTGAAFSGLQNMMGGGDFMAGVGKGFSPANEGPLSGMFGGVSPTITPAAGGPMAGANAAPLQTGAAPGFMAQAGNWIKNNPWPAVGIAGLGGAALMSAAQPSNEAPAIQKPTGPTEEQIQAARFKEGTLNTPKAPESAWAPTIPFSEFENYNKVYKKYKPYYYPEFYAAAGGELDARAGGHLEGPGTGTSDSIPARLSDGEFVMTAKAVKGAGNGSRKEGARRMYQLMHSFEKRAG